MKPLICPQCGGKITDYTDWQKFATCGYCDTKFVIEREPPKQNFQPEPEYQPYKTPTPNLSVLIGIVAFVFIIFGAVIFLSIAKNKPKTTTNYPNYPTPVKPNLPTPSPTPKSNPNLLEFGGKGTGNGLFQDADAIAVDKQGKIYVADDSLRVQQFNEKGEFLKVWQIPSQTIHYKRARTIQKIAVDDKNRLYVLVGGTILVYEPDASEPFNTFHAAPDFMVDFALRSDGTMLIVSSNDEIETLIFVNKAGKVTRRINGFHTETADAALSPRETGLAAIRLGVDGAGNIYSVYAFGDLGGYELNYDAEDLMIFRFTPEAKYVNKFAQTMNSCGIELDNQSRIYISDEGSINIYTNNGELVSTVPELGAIDAFALDKENNIYVLADDKVVKRPAVN